jgi:ribose-phosphate pyrophosphokinase
MRAGNDDVLIFAGKSGVDLAQRVATHIGTPVADAIVGKWPNGEVRVQLQANVRGSDVFIFQSFGRDVNDRVMELLVMLDAARRASAARTTVVLPYFPYSKQEKKFRGREPISARLVADLITCAGADRVLTMDLHEGAIQGFFNIPVDHLPSTPFVSKELKASGFGGPDWVVVAPDEGAVEATVELSGLLGCDIAVVFKRHPAHALDEVETVEIVGELRGRHALIWDDMILGGSTLCNAAEMVLERGALSAHAYVTHPVLCGRAMERLSSSRLEELIVTDTIPLPPEAEGNERIRVISVAEPIGKAVLRISKNSSVSELLEEAE